MAAGIQTATTTVSANIVSITVTVLQSAGTYTTTVT